MKRSGRALHVASVCAFVLSTLVPGWIAPAPTAAATAVDWPEYLANGQLTASSTETILTPAAAPNLRPLWTYKTGGMIAASATVVGGVAYVGSWDGYEYALNASTGALIWKTYLGITNAPNCSPPSLGVSSIPAVVGGVVYLGGGDGNWYALNASTGAVLWSITIGSPASGYYNWASPLIVGNSAYVGVASLGDCPLVQGQLLRVDLTTHAVVASVAFVPLGQVGGGVWTSPAIDTSTNTVYVTTGTLNQSTQVYSEAMVAVDGTTLAIKSSWQIPQSTMNADSDWGTSPILFTDQNGRALVAGVNKNGFLYAFLRSNVAAGPVWSDQVAVSGICPTCGDGSVASMAFAQGELFVPGGNTTISGVGYPGAVRAVDPATGNVLWARGLASPVIPAIAYDNGVVFAGAGKYLEALDAGSGNVLSSYQTGGVIYSPPSVSNGIVYMGSGDGNEYAFAPVTPTTPPTDSSCPTGWSCQDIGNPSPAGSETVASGSWSIAAGGAGIGLTGGTDQFRLMSQATSGDMQITARVASESGASTQTGLMARQANDPGSPFYAVTDVGGATIQVQYRTAFGGAVKLFAEAAPPLPVYLEIQRVGDTLTPAVSTDGINYTLIPGGTATVVMPTAAMVGLTADSGANGTAAAATVDTVAIEAPGAAPVPASSPGACPSGWSCTDIGNPFVVGSQTLSSGTWSLLGAGTGNAGYSDQLHFVYRAFAGDATLIAHVATQQNTSAGAQAGLEFRADTTAGAFYYGAFVTPTNGIVVLYRNSQGIRTANLATASGAAPQYLEITRSQTTYTSFTSPDGVNWSPIIGSSVTFGPTTGVVGGLAVSSNSSTTGATDTMDTVSATASASPPPSVCPSGWTCQNIGFPVPSGAQYVVGSSWTVQGGGGDIWGTADSFYYDSQPLTTDGTLSARIDTQSNSSSWAKAGVMMRATSDPGSPYFAVFMTPGNGIAVQWRTSQGASSSQVLAAGTVPAWLEIGRSGGTFTAYTSVDGLTWTAIPNASVNLGLSGTTIMAGLAVTSHNTSTLSTATFDTVTLTASAPPPPNACPTGWNCADIGSTGVAGAQSLTTGTWTVQGGGGDIWSTADNFHYVWQTVSTDVALSTRAISQANTSPWAKAGVMLRATSDPGSPYYAAFVTPGNGIAVQWRSVQAGSSSQLLVAGVAPVYLEIGRAGGVYSAYTSPDGVAWTLVPGSSVNLGLTGTTLAGLAVTSHNWGVLGSATFDTLRIAPLPPFWADADIGAPALAGSASATSGVFTQTAGGSDIYSSSDQFNFAYQPASGDATLTAHVSSQTNTSSWAKAGPMIRATTSAGSPYYAAFVTPGNGVAIQYRKTQGGGTTQVKTTGTVPIFLRVARSGNAFSAFTSPDGSTWALVPSSSVTFTFPAAELAGLAATSHNASKLGTVTYDTVSLTSSAAPPPNDFSIAATPATISVASGGTGSTSIGTALVSGTAETIALSATGAPTGVTTGFVPTSVSAGGSSTLTLTVSSSVAAGTYPITVTGTAPSATHSTTVTLTVTVTSANDFSITSKPSSLPMPQGTQGWSKISTAIVAGTAETINLSVSGAPTGVTAAFSPTSVTTGGSSTLSVSVGASVTTGTYSLVVTGTSPSATHTTKVTLTVGTAPAPLPSPWQSASIGSPAIPGWTSYSSGVFTVNAAGADIYGTSDQLEFAYQSVSAINSISAHVASQTNTSSWAKTGLMVRTTTDPGAPYYGVLVTPGNGVVVQWRSAQGGTTSQVKTTGTVPVWLEIGVSGGTYTAYTSADGITWTAITGSGVSLSLTGPLLAGMASTSHNASAACAATFDTVTLN